MRACAYSVCSLLQQKSKQCRCQGHCPPACQLVAYFGWAWCLAVTRVVSASLFLSHGERRRHQPICQLGRCEHLCHNAALCTILGWFLWLPRCVSARMREGRIFLRSTIIAGFNWVLVGGMGCMWLSCSQGIGAILWEQLTTVRRERSVVVFDCSVLCACAGTMFWLQLLRVLGARTQTIHHGF